MYLFLLTFLAIYGALHIYVFIRVDRALKPVLHLRRLLMLLMSILTVVPLLVRIAEHLAMERTAQFLAWPGYLWMGFLFIFASALLFADVVGFAGRVASRRSSSCHAIFTSAKHICVAALVVASCATVYACIEASRIRSEHLIIATPKLPPYLHRVRIVQVSDVHIGLLLQKQRQQAILERIREAAPDILISTGDLVDGKLNRDDVLSEFRSMASALASIPAPSGKFAVIGNHEIYAGLPQSLDFTRAAGFTVLRNGSALLANGITLTGLDDRAIYPGMTADQKVETSLIDSVKSSSFNILLKHRPEILPSSDGHFDLQLSGHVHGGQIFPFIFLVKLKHPIPCGTTVTSSGSRIHVSRGTGTWGPPMRLFSRPEVTIIDIVPKT